MKIRFPGRPKNQKQTPLFHVLFKDLFNPLSDNKKKPTSGQVRGRKAGPHGGHSLNPHEIRRAIIERFFSRWRREVGDDIYPAMRLILPEKDRERAMYGLKEKALAKFLVKIMRIDKNSEDAYNLINWKLPGQNASKSAGDFAMRVYETISKRAFRMDYGDMTIEEVNTELDDLSAKSKEEEQLPIIEKFYKRMNPEEMMWLVRVILRSMRVGATEKTFLEMWHPDAETLFNVCSNLRKVCYDLHSPNVRLDSEDRGVSLMQCFQPQLAFFNDRKQSSFTSMVASMKTTEDDSEFWIEEKLDGERMQLHMITEDTGERRFKFWSRKAKDYTYLYGESFTDSNSALTQHIKEAFEERVENVILDGEMITWDPELDVMVPFGTLKTAALAESRNPYAGGIRPLLRVFDILYLNDTDLTRYTLRDRRKALEASVKPIHRRIEILDYSIGKSAEDIETKLAKVIVDASEGLVIKNPRSTYRVNDRHDDWVKVKPEYMQEFGESLDCLIIGGYYGTGHRGGGLSSFLCGLRAGKKLRANRIGQSQSQSQRPTQSQSLIQNPTQSTEMISNRFVSFFKVGGGMSRDDYAAIRHHTEGKWIKWDPKRPPTEYIELAGGARQIERPDQWIKPEDSLVVEVKAASVNTTEDYATGVTLRFPRFKRFRQDKDWETALTLDQFLDLKANVEQEHEANKKKKQAEVASIRGKKGPSRSKKPLTVAGYNARDINDVQSIQAKSNVFKGLNIFVMTEALHPQKKSKLELEELIKANGGRIVQGTEIRDPTSTTTKRYLSILCIAERRTVKVASLIKKSTQEIIRPTWIFDCINQARNDFAKGLREIILPLEPKRHLFFTPSGREQLFTNNVDVYGDSFARDATVDDLKTLMQKNMNPVNQNYDAELKTSLLDPSDCRGGMFTNITLYFDPIETTQQHPHIQARQAAAQRTSSFAGATLTSDFTDETITHIVTHEHTDLKAIRTVLSGRQGNRIPRLVTMDWIEESWSERTRIDEERFAPLK